MAKRRRGDVLLLLLLLVQAVASMLLGEEEEEEVVLVVERDWVRFPVSRKEAIGSLEMMEPKEPEMEFRSWTEG